MTNTHVAARQIFLMLAGSALLSACQAAGVPHYDRVTLDESIQGGYGLAVADVDGDGRQWFSACPRGGFERTHPGNHQSATRDAIYESIPVKFDKGVGARG